MKDFAKKSLLFAFVAISGITPLAAREVSENAAREVAKNVLVSRGANVGTLERCAGTSRANRAHGGTPVYYVFNNGTAECARGFVIVSGDDRAVPVLGYSDEGAFDPATLSPEMTAWLDGLAAEMAALPDDDGTMPRYERMQPWGSSIAPLVKSKWGQDYPFNKMMPTVSNGNTAVTGCVATAMAQILYYHRAPVSCSEIPAYKTTTQEIEMPALPATTFSWNDMRDTYFPFNSNATAVQEDAVAKLMLYCAQALKMDFKDSESSAYSSDIPACLNSYFGMKGSRSLSRSGYTVAEWEQILYSELQARRPVVYHGQTRSGGHSFVCDGYDSATGLWHINWGWTGNSNGYFALSALTTRTQGIGSASGLEGYVLDQGMIIGISPNIQSPYTALRCTKVSLPNGNTYTRNNASADFKNVTVRARFSNYTGVFGSWRVGWAIYKDNSLVKMLPATGTISDLNHDWGAERSISNNFGSDLSNGTYRLVPMSCPVSSETWEVCDKSNVNYVKAVVTNTTLTLTVYGETGMPNFTLNSMSTEGYLHAHKTVTVVANIANKGNSINNPVYLSVDGEVSTAEILNINPGETGDIRFFVSIDNVGSHTLSFSLNDDGSNPFATRSLTITAIPDAELGLSHKVEGLVSTNAGRTLPYTTANVTTTVTNKANTVYDEDVYCILYRVTRLEGTTAWGSAVKRFTKPITLQAGATGTLNFTFDDLEVGQSYFVNYYYYTSEGEVRATGISRFMVTNSGTPAITGDVDGNGKVEVDDMNIVVNIMLNKASQAQWPKADVNGDGKVNIDDMNMIINILVKKA